MARSGTATPSSEPSKLTARSGSNLEAGSILTKSSKVFVLVAIAAIIGGVLGFLLRRHAVVRPRPLVTIQFPNLADGDCAIVRTPDHKIIVVDAGGPSSGERIGQFVRKMGGDQIDLLILASNQDSGIGGAYALLNSGLPVRSIWNSDTTPDDPTVKRLLDRIAARHIPYRIVHAGERAVIGHSDMRLSVLWPPDQSSRAALDGLAIRVEYGDNAVMLLGPISASSEPYAVAGAGKNLSCDVLQVSDHGADGGTSLEMLRRAAPEFALISCSAELPPSPGVLHRLQAAGAGIWRTDMQGSISLTMDGKTHPMLSAAEQ